MLNNTLLYSKVLRKVYLIVVLDDTGGGGPRVSQSDPVEVVLHEKGGSC